VHHKSRGENRYAHNQHCTYPANAVEADVTGYLVAQKDCSWRFLISPISFWPCGGKGKRGGQNAKTSPIRGTVTFVEWPCIAATKALGSGARRSKVP
jgi:hypothetical protein